MEITELNKELLGAAAPIAPVPFSDLLTCQELSDHEQAAFEVWAEDAWLRHAESQGSDEIYFEERHALLGY